MRRTQIASTALAFLFAAACGTVGTPGATPSPAAVGTTAGPAATIAIATATGSPSALGSPAASPAATAGAASAATSECVSTSGLAPGTAGASSVGVDVGQLVSRSDVEAAIGALTGSPSRVDLPLPGIIVSSCVFTSADGTLAIALGPQNLSKADFDSLMKLAPGMTSVSGVGDSAYTLKATVPAGMAGAASIFVLSSTQYFTIQAASRTKSSDALLTSITTLAGTASKKIP